MGKVSINNIGSQGKNETMYTYINKYQVNIITYILKLKTRTYDRIQSKQFEPADK